MWFHKNPKKVEEFKESVGQVEAGQLVSTDLGPDEGE
jgi:hypothetical protein